MAPAFIDTNITTFAAPEEPVDFNKGFKIKRPLGKLQLEILNEHPIDNKISFDEENHIYYFNGKQIRHSCTQVVERYFDKFDPDLAISKMRNGPRWPRKEYMNYNGTEMTDEEIKGKWDAIGLFARNKGTWMHYNIELLLNNATPNRKMREMALFESFYNNVIIGEAIQPWRTEWRIVAPDLNIAGSIDFVGKNIDGTYTIIDWKRSKDLANNMNSNFRRSAKKPISHLDDCDGSKYSIQLNMYRYILQRYYGLKVSGMLLASFHENSSEPFYAPVQPLDSEIEDILADMQQHGGGGNPYDTASLAAFAAPVRHSAIGDSRARPSTPPPTKVMKKPF